jgi:nucleotide-binding universal stress UspA family protein
VEVERAMTANSLLRRVLVPVASEADAAATARALAPFVASTVEEVVVVNVVEKAGGAPDKASVEQRERGAEEMFETVAGVLGDTDANLEFEVLYGADVGEAIIDAAHDLDATAIAFTPRGGSRWVKLLTGDVTTTLVSKSDVPIVVLPDDAEGAEP